MIISFISGGFVMDKNKNLLLIKEKYYAGEQRWKFPGGYAQKGEDFSQTAERELFQETGIQTKFKSIVAIRHHHQFQFELSDIYVVCEMKLIDEENFKQIVKPQLDEVYKVEWIHYQRAMEYLSPFNKMVLLTYLENYKNKTTIGLTKLNSASLGMISYYSLKF